MYSDDSESSKNLNPGSTRGPFIVRGIDKGSNKGMNLRPKKFLRVPKNPFESLATAVGELRLMKSSSSPTQTDAPDNSASYDDNSHEERMIATMDNSQSIRSGEMPVITTLSAADLSPDKTVPHDPAIDFQPKVTGLLDGSDHHSNTIKP